MRIRDFNSAIKEIYEEDPRSAITPRALRRAVVEGAIPSRRVGSGKQAKYVFDLDDVWSYFSGKDIEGVSDDKK